jgi:hypothetical protein
MVIRALANTITISEEARILQLILIQITGNLSTQATCRRQVAMLRLVQAFSRITADRGMQASNNNHITSLHQVKACGKTLALRAGVNMMQWKINIMVTAEPVLLTQIMQGEYRAEMFLPNIMTSTINHHLTVV